MSQISKLIELSKNNPTNTEDEVNFGNLPNFQAQEINRLTGIKTNGAKKILTVYGISHIFKEHGVGTKQSERGQKDILASDLELIPLIMSHPDNIEKGKPNRRGHSSIKFFKEINTYYYCVIASFINSRGALKLHVDTMFAKNKKPM